MSGIGAFLSSFLPTTHADAEEPKEEDSSAKNEAAEAPEDTKEDAEGGEPAAEEEEAEPEDEHPAIRAACVQRAECAPMKAHFEHCQEKIQAGKGFKGEECVEEIMMHCSEACAAPKIFAKLR